MKTWKTTTKSKYVAKYFNVFKRSLLKFLKIMLNFITLVEAKA